MLELSDQLRHLADTLDLYRVQEVWSIHTELICLNQRRLVVLLPWKQFGTAFPLANLDPFPYKEFPWELFITVDDIYFHALLTDEQLAQWEEGGKDGK